MDVADACPEFALGFYGGGDGAVRRTPRHDQQVAFGIAYGNDIRNILDDGFDFRGADANHVFVVQWFIVDVAGHVLLFQAADAVFEAGSSGYRPGAGQSVWITAIRFEVHRIGRKFHFKVGDGVEVGNSPRFSTVREIAVAQNDHRNHVLDGDAGGFHGGPEAIAGSCGSDDGNWRFGVTAEQSLQ